MILIMVLFYYMWSSDNYLLVAPIEVYGVVIIHLLFKIIIPKEFLYLLELE